MNIIESSHKLLEWFSENSSFNLEDSYKTLLPGHISETPEADKASILAALEELIINGVLKKADIGQEVKLAGGKTKTVNKTYYILVRTLNSFNQTIQISPITSMVVYEILKQYSDATNNKDILPNVLQLSENDILTALTILKESTKIANNK